MTTATQPTIASTTTIATDITYSAMDLAEQVMNNAYNVAFVAHAAAPTPELAHQLERLSAGIRALTGGEGPEFAAAE